MKILMLDIDGVLNSTIGWKRDKPKTWAYLTDECVAQLARIFTALPDVKAVLSSSWRHHMPIKDLQKCLRQAGVPIDIIGKTPDVRLSGTLRGIEIQSWLDHEGKGKVEKLVILDDDIFDMEHLKPQCVQTDSEVGLTAEKADEVIRRLS